MTSVQVSDPLPYVAGDRPRYGIYERDGDVIIPSKAARSPWSPGLQSGHALAPLLATLAEEIPALAPMYATRMVLNLARPVPMSPLRACKNVVREGKKLQAIQVSLQHESGVVADLSVVRAREGHNAVPYPVRRYPGPEHGEPFTGPRVPRRFEVRVLPQTRRPGGITFWLRMHVDVFPDQPATPLAHALCLGDFGSGLGEMLDYRNWSFPNFDITLHLFRRPVGEWLLLDCDAETAGLGTVLVSGIVADQDGVFGRSHQTLLVDAVPAPALREPVA
jgi:hypothetical protein